MKSNKLRRYMQRLSVYGMIQVDWLCPKCEKANLEFTGWVNEKADLAYYQNKCPKCKYKVMLMHKYPYLEYPETIDVEVKNGKVVKKKFVV